MNLQNFTIILFSLIAITACNDKFDCDIPALSTRNGCAAPESPNGFSPEELIAIYTDDNGIPTQTTASGLVYNIINPGSGESPTVLSSTTVDYVGYYRNGCEFDSNNEIEFPLANVIPGWTEGLQLIGSCGTIQLFIIPGLGYNNNTSNGIPANEPLIFDVNLLGFE
jgi:hypothetical protein